jgi:hypothetical protein
LFSSVLLLLYSCRLCRLSVMRFVVSSTAFSRRKCTSTQTNVIVSGFNVRASLHLGELRDDRDLERTGIDISDQVVVGDESAVLAHPEARRQERECKKARRQFQPLGLTVHLTLLLHDAARSSTEMTVSTMFPPSFVWCSLWLAMDVFCAWLLRGLCCWRGS